MVRSAASFQERWPWLGPDLQTLRDTIRPLPLPADRGEPITIDLDSISVGPGPGAGPGPGRGKGRLAGVGASWRCMIRPPQARPRAW